MHKTLKQLLELAENAAQNAYAPYSNFRVGACIMYEDGSVYTGCNVENASYGLSLCAERTAIAKAVSDGKHSGLKYVAIISTDAEKCFPCGACRQWIAEFSKSAKIIVRDKSSEPLVFSINELLPHAFSL